MTPAQRKQKAFDKAFGKRLKKLRVSKGVQAKFVAVMLDMHKSHLSEMEHGRRHWHPHHVKAYLKAIGE